MAANREGRTALGLHGVVLALLLLAPTSSAAPGGKPMPMDPAELSRIARFVASAAKVTVSHQPVWTLDVAFTTTKPCKRRLEGAEFSRRLDQEWVSRFSDLIGLDSLPPLPGKGEGRYCDLDSIRSDGVQLVFERGRHTVSLAVQLNHGAVNVRGEDEAYAERWLAGRSEVLRQMLLKALPSDTTLADAVACNGEAPVAPNPGALPRGGEYVYVEQLPEPISRVAPSFPEAARVAGIGGQVMVQALIGKDGVVRSTVIVRSIPALDEAAVRAVEQWRFKPATSDGIPVAVWVAIPVKFSLH